MNTKDVGTIGESIAITELLKAGITVSRPIGDNSRYDLILDIRGTLFTCQVKSTASSTSDLAEFWLQSSQAHRGKDRQHYDVDLFALVDVNKDRLFILMNTEKRTAIKIRYSSGAVNQHFADDYSLSSFIEKL